MTSSRTLAIALLLVLVAGPLTASAQGREMSTADRVAMLYAPQLNFTRDGDPLIRLGILEGRDSVEFTPTQPIRVMPHGEGGAEIHLPANTTYTVSITDSRAGEYKHWVVVDRVSVDKRARVDDVNRQWTQRGYIPESFEVGGLFAVHGQLFDSRVILVCVGGTATLAEANKIRAQLEARYGIAGAMHSERLKFPSGLLTLKGKGVDVTVQHRDVMWASAMPGKEETIAYTIPNIRKSYERGEETRRYTGSLIFAADRNGKVVVINSLGAEKVLKGVVPAEVYASAPENALQAQAIAARNEIFAAIGVRNLADPYMLRADVYDQVYGGIDVEHPRTSAAVEATRGEVMLYGTQIVNAVYSSNAAGFTENNENVWDAEPRPHLRGKLDTAAANLPAQFKGGVTEAKLEAFLASDFPAYSKDAPVGSAALYRWTRTVEAKTPIAWLKEAGHDIGRIKDVKVLSRGVSGRVIRFELKGEKSDAVIERELNVRRLFGGLRSGLFIVTFDRDKNGFVTNFHFRGGGFGHGVGMCQTGAVGMAAKGHSHKEILLHYYQGIGIRKLY
ncbi:MAG: SpoIID/LytB domain-containing protein [Bradymonadaceae bacterium]|nr:SpoIID/LytB domain-containing protein [Lujinxingiaceae bacterium]